MEEKGTAVREGGLLAPGNAGADGDGADRRADVMPAGPGDRPATLGGRPGKASPVPAADGYEMDYSLTGLLHWLFTPILCMTSAKYLTTLPYLSDQQVG